jgi:hypothetical protein
MSEMTTRQMIAIAAPCARAVDTLASEFSRALRIGSVSLPTILTVNK